MVTNGKQLKELIEKYGANFSLQDVIELEKAGMKDEK